MFAYLPTHIVVYLYALAAILGAVLGSGLNCLSYRLAREQKWTGKERSVCVHCGHTLATKDLIPVLSFLFLKGKCRYCGKKLSKRYVLTELLLSLIFVSLLWRYGLTPAILTPLVLCCCLFCLSLVDLDTFIIPDRFLVIPAICRAAELLITGGFKGLITGIIPGLIIGGAVLALSLIMDKILKKDTMGGGDIKLLALLGMFFTLPECLLLVMIACVVGIAMASILMKVDAETAFPFGPAIAIAAWITLLVGSDLVNWYLSLF